MIQSSKIVFVFFFISIQISSLSASTDTNTRRMSPTTIKLKNTTITKASDCIENLDKNWISWHEHNCPLVKANLELVISNLKQIAIPAKSDAEEPKNLTAALNAKIEATTKAKILLNDLLLRVRQGKVSKEIYLNAYGLRGGELDIVKSDLDRIRNQLRVELIDHVEKTGKPIDVVENYEGLFSLPDSFDIKIKPSSDKNQEKIKFSYMNSICRIKKNELNGKYYSAGSLYRTKKEQACNYVRASPIYIDAQSSVRRAGVVMTWERALGKASN